jgi:hypothetical protein
MIRKCVFLAVAVVVLAWTTSAQAQTQTVPFKVYITELWQLDTNVDPVVGVIGDYYARVTINGVSHDNKGACRDGLTSGLVVPFRLFSYFDRIAECSARTPWLFTQDVPAGQKVHVKIQVFDEDDLFDDEADLLIGDGNAIDVDVDPATGQWSGDVNWPQDCSRPNLNIGGNNANVCWQASFDSDNDGLLDVWERFGVDTNNDGVIDVLLPGADPLHHDLFVEADYLEASDHTHAPTEEAIKRVVAAYANAPIANPDGTTGIQLHVDVGPLYGANTVSAIAGPGGVVGTYGDLGGGNAIAESGNEIIDSSFGAGAGHAASFADLKTANFAAGRDWLYRYAIFGHQTNGRAAVNDCTTGLSSASHRDFMVTLGGVGDNALPCWDTDANNHSVGSSIQQSGTFMHELGHGVGLLHGGDVQTNNKPNYLSVMNYSFQFCSTPRKDGILPGGCDYSRLVAGEILPPLDESSLDECLGLGTALGFGSFDWNGDGKLAGVSNCSALMQNVIADVNNDGVCITPGGNGQLNSIALGDDTLEGRSINDGRNRVCNSSVTQGSDDLQFAAVNTTPSQPNVLTSFDDWGHLDFTSLLDRLIAGDQGLGALTQEADAKDIANARRNLRDLTLPVLQINPVGPATARPGDVVTYTMTVTNAGHGPALETTLQTRSADGTIASADLGQINVGASVTGATTSFKVPAHACPGDVSTGANAALTFTDLAGDSLTASAAASLRILDVEAPQIDLYLTPDVLFPANHKLVRVIAEIRTRDNCDRHPAVTLVSITSNERDGNRYDPDIQGATFGTNDRVFFLRAEHETGRGHDGRVYTVTYRVTDTSGNATTRTATVTVPLHRDRDHY